MRALALGLAAALTLALPAAAQQRPNLSGYWDLARGTPVEDADLKAKLTPGVIILKDTGAPELEAGDYGGLKPKPAALAAAKAWKPADDMTLDRVCKPPSIVYATQGPFPMEIHQGTEMIVIKMEYYDMVRIIFMDGRPHPAEGPHSATGHSTGKWEGDTLVVDTVNLGAATITNNGLAHSDKIHVIERFKLSPDGKSLITTMEFEDPENLENRGARFITYSKRDGEYVYPYECDPSFAQNYTTK